jgi:hypothetical protein
MENVSLVQINVQLVNLKINVQVVDQINFYMKANVYNFAQNTLLQIMLEVAENAKKNVKHVGKVSVLHVKLLNYSSKENVLKNVQINISKLKVYVKTA